eukprot:scaffold209201_cov50-Prasinocladus_malaysianus.AAC.1
MDILHFDMIEVRIIDGEVATGGHSICFVMVSACIAGIQIHQMRILIILGLCKEPRLSDLPVLDNLQASLTAWPDGAV